MFTYHYNKHLQKAFIYDGPFIVKTLVVTEPYFLKLISHTPLEDIVALKGSILTPLNLKPLFNKQTAGTP